MAADAAKINELITRTERLLKRGACEHALKIIELLIGVLEENQNENYIPPLVERREHEGQITRREKAPPPPPQPDNARHDEHGKNTREPRREEAPSDPHEGREQGTRRRDRNNPGKWVTVARKGAKEPKRLRAADWEIPVVDQEDLRNGDLKEGVALVTNEDKETLEDIKVLQTLTGGRYALVSKRPLEEKSTKQTIYYEGGLGADMFITLVGAPPPKPTHSPKRVTADKEPTVTRAISCVIPHRYLTDQAVKLLTEEKSAGYLDKLCRESMKAAGIKTGKEHRWGHRKLPGRSEMQVRVSGVDASKLLRKSGENGIFWRSHSFKNGSELEPVLWLKETTPLQTALSFCKLTGALGLVAATKRIGLRIVNEGYKESLLTQVGVHAMPPKEETTPRYVITGAIRQEHDADIISLLNKKGWKCEQISTFCKDDKRTVIASATEKPEFGEVGRGEASTLFIRESRPEDRPKKKSKEWSGKLPSKNLIGIKLEDLLQAEEIPSNEEKENSPTINLTKSRPGTKRRRGNSPEADSSDSDMETDAHSWKRKDVQKATGKWKCAICNKNSEGSFYLTCDCGCGAAKCNQCQAATERK